MADIALAAKATTTLKHQLLSRQLTTRQHRRTSLSYGTFKYGFEYMLAAKLWLAIPVTHIPSPSNTWLCISIANHGPSFGKEPFTFPPS